MGLPVKEF